MSHFAKVEFGVVTNVIVAEQEFIDSGAVGDPSQWVQTSYNTHGGVHLGPDRNPDGGVALRKNYAGIGHIYDAVRDAFYEPQPFPSWTLNEQSCVWEAPVAMPQDGSVYFWDEDRRVWVVELA